MAAAEALLLAWFHPQTDAAVPRGIAGRRRRVAIRRVAGEMGCVAAGYLGTGDHSSAVCRVLPGAGRGAAGPRDADRPGKPVVHSAARAAGAAVADGGV